MTKDQMMQNAFTQLTQAETQRDALAEAWDKFVTAHDKYLDTLSIDNARKALSQSAYTNELNRTYSDMRSAREVVETIRDLITVSAAAKLAGYSYSGIVRLMERGALPEYWLTQPANDERMFTSKAAVAALPPKPTRAKAAKRKKGGK